jgi:phage shock protein E
MQLPADYQPRTTFFSHQFPLIMLIFLKKLLGLGPSADFAALIQNGALIIDVRTPAEFKSGHIKGSTNIPLDQIAGKTEFLKAKNVPVITVCRSGARSGMAKGILKSAGIEVYNGGPWNALEARLR